MAASAQGRKPVYTMPREESKDTPQLSSLNHMTCFRAEGQVIPAECAVKIFKTTLNEFKNRDRYIKDDYRFKDRFGKQNPRKLVKLWAEKEMHNLKR